MSLSLRLYEFGLRLRAVERRKWIMAALSIIITATIMYGFLIENRTGYMRPDPIIAYFKSWSDNRSREDALSVQAEEKRLEAEADAIAAKLDIGAAPATE